MRLLDVGGVPARHQDRVVAQVDARAARRTEDADRDGAAAPQTFIHNQISILESSIQAIDRESEDHVLFRYGDDSVVELNLICEYLLHAAGYLEIMPQLIKDDLAVEAATTPRRRF